MTLAVESHVRELVFKLVLVTVNFGCELVGWERHRGPAAPTALQGWL